MSYDFKAGLWRLADPKISITSAASMAIGASMAAGHPDFSWSWPGALLLAMFCMEVAKNAWGEIFDYDWWTDLAVAPEDRTDFSGDKRVLVDYLLSRRQTLAIAAFLWVNELPDHDADRSAGKRNLVDRLGKLRASLILPLIYLAGPGLLLMAISLGSLPGTGGEAAGNRLA